MAEPVEVAIEIALLDKATAFAAAQSLPISLPNRTFVQPTPGPAVKWLRASFMPVPSLAMGINYDSFVQHYGIFQLDVFQGFDGGSTGPARIAASIIAAFQRGTRLTGNGFAIDIVKVPYRGPMLKDDPWGMVPVSIPYLSFARPT